MARRIHENKQVQAKTLYAGQLFRPAPRHRWCRLLEVRKCRANKSSGQKAGLEIVYAFLTSPEQIRTRMISPTDLVTVAVDEDAVVITLAGM